MKDSNTSFPANVARQAFHDRGAATPRPDEQTVRMAAREQARAGRTYLEKGKVQDIAIGRKLHTLKILDCLQVSEKANITCWQAVALYRLFLPARR